MILATYDVRRTFYVARGVLGLGSKNKVCSLAPPRLHHRIVVVVVRRRWKSCTRVHTFTTRYAKDSPQKPNGLSKLVGLPQGTADWTRHARSIIIITLIFPITRYLIVVIFGAASELFVLVLAFLYKLAIKQYAGQVKGLTIRRPYILRLFSFYLFTLFNIVFF